MGNNFIHIFIFRLLLVLSESAAVHVAKVLDPDFRPYLPGTGHSVHQKVGSRLPVLSSRYEAGPRLRSSLLTTRTLTFCEKLCVDRHLAESDSVVTGKVVNAESSSVVV